MKILPFALLMLGTWTGSSFGNQNTPLFALIEYNPWAMVMGSDSPAFVLYEDGTVVYLRKNDDSSCTYYTCNIRSNKTLLATFDLQSRCELKNSYEISDWTDQPSTVFYWNDKKIHIYGDILHPPPGFEGDPEFKNEYEKSLKLWKTCPPQLKELLINVRAFDCPRAAKWLPEKIEVMFWPYEYAPDESIVWPDAWPGLDDETTGKRGRDSYSVYVPSDQYDALIAFLGTQKEKGAVLISGKKMSASIRFPFPQEQRWMQ